MNKFGYVIFGMGIISSTHLWAQSNTQYNIHQQYLSPRALGMGNAFTAVADDTNALFYNPAGLARVEAGNMEFMLQAGADPKLKSLMNDINSASKSSDQVTAFNDLLSKNYGKTYGLRGPGLGWLWARPNWGIGFIPADVSLDVGFHQLTGPSMNARAIVDSTFVFGLANQAKVGGGTLSFGATAKAIYRGNFDKDVLAMDLAQDKNVVRVEDMREGFTVDADIGVMYQPEWDFLGESKASFAGVVRNAIDGGYMSNMHLFNKNSQNGPEKLGRRFDLGAALRLPDFSVWKTTLALDIKDIGHEYWTLEKGFHLGAEFKWAMASWFQGAWRAGVSQSFSPAYWTAGFTGKFTAFQLDLLSYPEEMGTSAAKKQNRRYLIRLSLVF